MNKSVDKMPKIGTVRGFSRQSDKSRGRMKPQNDSTSEKNRKDLQAWFKQSKYEDVKFWVPPNVLASQEECVAEVVAAVTKFDADTKKKPANEDVRL